MPDDTKTNNVDVAGLCNRINRFMEEALHCQSANAAHVTGWDLDRMKSYLGACVNYKNWVSSTPQLDTPETHPQPVSIQCPSLEDIDKVENESVKDWCRHMFICFKELAHSQSSRLATGLVSHDQRRFDDTMAKLSAFLTEYVEVTLPLDLPESVPSREGVAPGKTGI